MSSYAFRPFLSRRSCTSTKIYSNKLKGKKRTIFFTKAHVSIFFSVVQTSHAIINFSTLILGFEVVRKIAFEWQFVACRSLGSTLIVTDAGNDVSGRNFGSNGFRQGFDSILGVILNSWVPTNTRASSLTERYVSWMVVKIPSMCSPSSPMNQCWMNLR